MVATAVVGIFAALIFLFLSAFLFNTIIYALILSLVFLAVVISVTVRHIEVSGKGIRFVRLLGSPRFLTWAEIQSIKPVGRREILVKGWLSFPPREATASMTSKGHYKFQWKDGYCYYPPRDIAEFHEIVVDKLKGKK